MKNYIQPGAILELAAPYAVTSGQGALVGSIFGVATKTLANGERGTFNITGVHDLTKAAGAVTEGQLLYWDNSAKNVTTTASTNKIIGAATLAAQSGDATVRVRLSGQNA